MADEMAKKPQLRPYVVEPTAELPYFSMTRLSPATDDFYFWDDELVILSPMDVVWQAPILARSMRSLEEHIQYIRENQITKACVIAEDISFLRRCPSLTSLRVILPYSAAVFDYSPLYDLPNLRELDCQTVYGPKDDLKAVVDYSHFHQLERLYASGAKGHQNLASVKGIRSLYLGQGQPASKTLTDFDFSRLEELDICQSPLRSLAGLEKAVGLRKISLSHCRVLEDVSALAAVGETLTSLEIHSCGKIKDFGWLKQLPHLENLALFGSNSLPDLDFLESMKKLRCFRFTMNVVSGDLSLCKNLRYVYCKNRRHYNLKNDDLPK